MTDIFPWDDDSVYYKHDVEEEDFGDWKACPHCWVEPCDCKEADESVPA